MSTKFYGQSQETCESILQAFESGEIVKPLAQVFVRRKDDIPSRRWSWCNQLLKAMNGRTADARGFRQWEEAGRKVRKGARSFKILGPCTAKVKDMDPETGEETEKMILFGFKSIPVFRLEDTELVDPDKWQEGIDQAEEDRLKALPLADVAEKWGLKVVSYNGRETGPLGYYSPGSAIAVGVENLATWCHELVHAADYRLGTLTLGPGQDPGNETVAEMGGAVLLTILGHEKSADLGGCFEYIRAYANGNSSKAIRRAMSLIDRICNCVELILATAEGRAPSAKIRQQAKPAEKSGEYKGKALKAYDEYRQFIDTLPEGDRARVSDLIVDRPASPGIALMKIRRALA